MEKIPNHPSSEVPCIASDLMPFLTDHVAPPRLNIPDHSYCVLRAEQVPLVDTRLLCHVEHSSDPHNSSVCFLAEEETTFSKTQIPKRSEKIFPENLRYRRI